MCHALDISGPIDGDPEPQVSSCRDGFDNIKGYCYMLSEIPMDWISAERLAEQNSAHLAALRSAEQEDVLDFYRKRGRLTDDVWIGLNSIEQAGEWVYIGGQTYTWRNWASNQPNNEGGRQDCVRVQRDSGRWYDDSCGLQHLALLKWSASAKPRPESKAFNSSHSCCESDRLKHCFTRILCSVVQ